MMMRCMHYLPLRVQKRFVSVRNSCIFHQIYNQMSARKVTTKFTEEVQMSTKRTLMCCTLIWGWNSYSRCSLLIWDRGFDF